MRFYQIINEDDPFQAQGSSPHGAPPQLITVLNFIKNRAADQGVAPKINTVSLINMVKNTGVESFSYNDLVSANDNDSTIQNLIKSMNNDEIILNSDDTDATSTDDNEDKGMKMNPQDTVDAMAKRAASKREY